MIQGLFTLLSVAIACISITKWRQPRLMYFTCLSIIIGLISLGYMLEITAPSLDAAIIAAKIQQCGTPFVGVLYLLFCLDYCSTTLENRRIILFLFAVPIVVSLAAFTWPLQSWYYNKLLFVQTNGLYHLVVFAGPLYAVNFIYNLFISGLGCWFIVRYYKNTGPAGRQHANVVLLALVLPVVAQVLHLSNIPANGWNFIPAALTINAAVLLWYIVTFRQSEWQSLGRELVVENMKDAFVLLDTRNRFVDANAAAYRYFPELQQMHAGKQASVENGFPAQLLSRDDSNFTLNLNEDTLYLRTSHSRLRAADTVLGTGIMIYDDTENHHLMGELQQLATHDALTELYNRGTFFSYASRDFSLCVRKREPGSVLMMDIDHFKRVNDTHGHASGDRVLVAVATVLQERLRHTDIFGRYGGEELAVWLPGAVAEGATMIADVIRRAVEHTSFDSDTGHFHVTISIGVAAINYSRRQSFEDLISDADNALYQAKNEGRNRVCLYREPAAPPLPSID